MITAAAQPIDQNHLRLVFSGPDGFKQQPITVADAAEARRLVYFYNRLYICDTMRTWLKERGNVFAHVDDVARVAITDELIRAFGKYSKTSLRQVCGLVIELEKKLETITPREASRYYSRYKKDITPIIIFCNEMRGVQQAC